MRSDEFISLLTENCKDEESLKKLRAGVPLGRDMADNVVFSQKHEKPYFRHTCVTGGRRTAFIKRLMITLSCLYDKTEANFLVLSPRAEYGELLRLSCVDLTAPFVRLKSDLDQAKTCVKELLDMHEREKGCPRLIIILDGLEDLPDCNKNGDLEEYRDFFELIARKENVEVISGAELMRSIFSGYPGAFVGVGNCLVTTQGNGKADITYVGEDSSLSMPTPILFPDEPNITETVILLNSLAAKE